MKRILFSALFFATTVYAQINSTPQGVSIGLGTGFADEKALSLGIGGGEWLKFDKIALILDGNTELDAWLNKDLVGVDIDVKPKIGLARYSNNKAVGILLGANINTASNRDVHRLGESRGYTSFSPQLFFGISNIQKKDLSCSLNVALIDVSTEYHTIDYENHPAYRYVNFPNFGYTSGLCYSVGLDIDAVIKESNSEREIQIEGFCDYYSKEYVAQEGQTPVEKLVFVNTGVKVRYKISSRFGIYTKVEFTDFSYDDNIAGDEKSTLYLKAGLFFQNDNK